MTTLSTRPSQSSQELTSYGSLVKQPRIEQVSVIDVTPAVKRLPTDTHFIPRENIQALLGALLIFIAGITVISTAVDILYSHTITQQAAQREWRAR